MYLAEETTANETPSRVGRYRGPGGRRRELQRGGERVSGRDEREEEVEWPPGNRMPGVRCTNAPPSVKAGV
jgi:hypothetical protein